MNAFAHLVWAIANSIWQSAIVAALAWGVLRSMRQSTAALRYSVWCGVLAAAAILPAVNEALPAAPFRAPTAHVAQLPVQTYRLHQIPMGSTARTDGNAGRVRFDFVLPAPKVEESPPRRLSDAALATIPKSSQWTSDHSGALVVLWALAAGLSLMRLAGGFARLRHIKSRLTRLRDDDIAAALQGAPRRVAVGASADVDCPCVIGYVRPVVALPVALIRDLDRASLVRVLAHELAHVRRWDDWGNLLQQIIRAIWFINPIVHVACRQLDVDREIACDDLVAAGQTDRIEFARCLTEIARRTTFAEHLVPAAGFFPDRKQIVVRIEQLLDRNHNGSARLGAVPAVSAALLAVAVITLAKYQIPAFADNAPPALPTVQPLAPAAAAPAAALRPAVPPVASAVFTIKRALVVRNTPVARPRIVLVAMSDLAPLAPGSPQALATLATNLRSLNATVALASTRAAVAQAPPRPGNNGMDDFLDALATAGYTRLTVDELIAVRNAGVTSDYLRGLKKHGVLPMPIDRLIQLANSGVGPSYIAGMHDAGYGVLPVDDLISMANAGVNPDFARAAASYLHSRPSLQELVGMANAGVSSAYVANLAKMGYANMSADALISLANAGVSSSYVGEMVKLGYAKMSVDTLVALANAGVSPAYVKSMADVGYSSVSTDDLIRLANSGVTAKLVKSLRSHGIGSNGNLSIDELIKLSNAGF